MARGCGRQELCLHFGAACICALYASAGFKQTLPTLTCATPHAHLSAAHKTIPFYPLSLYLTTVLTLLRLASSSPAFLTGMTYSLSRWGVRTCAFLQHVLLCPFMVPVLYAFPLHMCLVTVTKGKSKQVTGPWLRRRSEQDWRRVWDISSLPVTPHMLLHSGMRTCCTLHARAFLLLGT